ncbi:MAG: DUF47 family protein [Oceanospirillaceae bacterium]|nr:DUF47 family protein [Oceanospirillaceae bacterium]
MTPVPTSERPWWRRLWQQLVPPTPDFHALLEAQADNLRATVAALADYMQSGEPAMAEPVQRLVEQGHRLRDRNLDQLYRSFVTPIDREDIYTLAMSIDHILDYLKNTVREVEVLQITPDDWMCRMTAELGEGVASLALGLARFRPGASGGVARSVQTRSAERQVEDLYRDALEEMFSGEEYRQLTRDGEPSVSACLDFVVSRIKRREVYRHLSNAADRLARAGEALRDISIKYEGD